MDTQQIISELEQFIREDLLLGRRTECIPAEKDLLTSGIITSLGLLRLLSFISERFGVNFSAQDLAAEHFQNVQVIAQRIEARQALQNT